jgi:hypothetical protein
MHELYQSRAHDERPTKWLDPTVDVVYAFSHRRRLERESVWYVLRRKPILSLDSYMLCFVDFLTRKSYFYWSRRSPFSAFLLSLLARAIVICRSLRQQRMFVQVKGLLSTYSSAYNISSVLSKSTRHYNGSVTDSRHEGHGDTHHGRGAFYSWDCDEGGQARLDK